MWQVELTSAMLTVTVREELCKTCVVIAFELFSVMSWLNDEAALVDVCCDDDMEPSTEAERETVGP
jgi:hypothetical protein